MRRVAGWLAAFARFWYGFIVGDDWTVAATVTVALVVTLALRVAGWPAWWLTPLVVVAVVGVSLRRAGVRR
ncbi:MAG TPA: hypothetical protein VK131_04765 [Candidatus Acidoferrales bacterium]|nr:hypothetical protein [Candidatus Acidoferrales bacterium]